MDLMRDKPDDYWDLAIVDPEYGIQNDKEINTKGKALKGPTFKRVQNNHKPKSWDNKAPDQVYFDELLRVSKNQIIWGGNYFTNYLHPTKAWIFWHKKITNSNDVNFSDGEMAWTSFKKITKYFAYDWNGFGYLNNPQGEKKIHVTQKPVALYKWLLKNYAKPGDKILDSHGGSFSHAIAVHDMNHQAEPMNLSLDIIELDKDYFEAGKKRFENHIKQLTIF